MSLVILLGLFAFCVIIGLPVAFALGIASLATFWWEGLPLMIAFQRIVSGVNVFSLLAIPFFIFAGELMFHGGIAMRLVKFASAAVGYVRGGLGVVNVFSSMLFGGISGSAVADVSALGSILIPVMKEKGYDEDYAVNVTVTSSIAGILIPPSHNMILFAVAAGGGISISQLFAAGVVPGVIMCICLATAAYLVAVKRGYPSEPFPGWTVLGITFITAVPGLFTAVINGAGTTSITRCKVAPRSPANANSCAKSATSNVPSTFCAPSTTPASPACRTAAMSKSMIRASSSEKLNNPLRGRIIA